MKQLPRRYLTAKQRAVLKAFVDNGGRANIATGSRYEHIQAGLLLLPMRLFNAIRGHDWIDIDREANAASTAPSGCNWVLTNAGHLVYQRGYYHPELGDP